MSSAPRIPPPPPTSAPPPPGSPPGSEDDFPSPGDDDSLPPPSDDFDDEPPPPSDIDDDEDPDSPFREVGSDGEEDDLPPPSDDEMSSSPSQIDYDAEAGEDEGDLGAPPSDDDDTPDDDDVSEDVDPDAGDDDEEGSLPPPPPGEESDEDFGPDDDGEEDELASPPGSDSDPDPDDEDDDEVPPPPPADDDDEEPDFDGSVEDDEVSLGEPGSEGSEPPSPPGDGEAPDDEPDSEPGSEDSDEEEPDSEPDDTPNDGPDDFDDVESPRSKTSKGSMASAGAGGSGRGAGGGKYKLPGKVRTASMAQQLFGSDGPDGPSDEASERSGGGLLNMNLDAVLGSGLVVKDAPDLLSGEGPSHTTTAGAGGGVDEQKDDASSGRGVGSKANGAAGAGAAGAKSTVTDEVFEKAKVRAEALEQGYIAVQGKFEGDDFEALFLKLVPHPHPLHRSPSHGSMSPDGSGNGMGGGGSVDVESLSMSLATTGNASAVGAEAGAGAGAGAGSKSGDRDRLLIRIAAGLEMDFDLRAHAYVFEDSKDPCTVILDYHRTIIVFKFESENDTLLFMKHLPPSVFMVAQLSEEEERLLHGGGDSSNSSNSSNKSKSKHPHSKTPPAAPKPQTGLYANAHVKGQSVEDILENDFLGPGGAPSSTAGSSRQEQLDMLFSVGPSGSSLAPSQGVQDGVQLGRYTGPQRHKELLDTHIRRPQYSVRRVTLICEWINSLHIWPNTVSVDCLHKEMCSGLLLARVVKTINPSVRFVNLNEKALAKKPALQNLEQALGHIWRAKSLNNSRIPSAMEIYLGNTAKIGILLNELFGVYVQRPLYKNALRVLRWYHNVLRQYNRPLPSGIFEEGDLSGVWPHFQSGTALFCVVYHFFGPNYVGDGAATAAAGSGSGGGNGGLRIRVDPLRVSGMPSSLCDFRSNLMYVFKLLECLGIDVIWTPEDWLSNPDTEFILLQLSYIYEALKHRQSALPPAQGSNAGMTSGPNGEPLVVGMIFSDTRPLNSRIAPVKGRRAVLLGHDKDSMPLLPVDRGGATAKGKSRFSSTQCPLGMVSHNAQLASISVDLRERHIHSDRGKWDTSAASEGDRVDPTNRNVLQLLRAHNKRDAEGGASTYTSLAARPTKELVPLPGPGTLASGQLVTAEQKAQHAAAGVTGTTVALSSGGPASTPPPPPPPPPAAYSAASKRASTNSAHLARAVLIASTAPASSAGIGGGGTGSGGSGAMTMAEQRAVELEQAVQALEQEMRLSETQLNGLEEELANRYLELEAEAEELGADEYEAALDALELERAELEAERFKLQDHFARKLSTIKDAYAEVEFRASMDDQAQHRRQQEQLEQQQRAPPFATPGEAASPSTSTSATPREIRQQQRLQKQHQQHQQQQPGAPGAGKQQARRAARKTPAQLEREAKARQQAERGWLSSVRQDSHNFPLKNKLSASQAKLQETWTPRAIKERERQRQREERQRALARITNQGDAASLLLDTPDSRGSSAAVAHAADQLYLSKQQREAKMKQQQQDQAAAYSEGKRVDGQHGHGLTAEQKVEQSFTKFKYRLHVSSVKWLQARQQTGRERLMDLINSSSATPKVELISLPEKSFSHSGGHHGDDAYAAHGPGAGRHGQEGQQEQLSAEQQEQLREIAQAIRADELMRMAYEDERRRMVLSDQALRETYQRSESILSAAASVPASQSQQPFSASSSIKHRDGGRPGYESPGGGGYRGGGSVDGFYGASTSPDSSPDTRYYSPQHQQQHQKQQQRSSSPEYKQRPRPSVAEVDAAYSWLSQERTLRLADRTPKDLIFIVVDQTVLGSDNDSTPYNSGVEGHSRQRRRSKRSGAGGSRGGGGEGEEPHEYVLQWRESIALGNSVQDYVMGLVNVADMRDIVQHSAPHTVLRPHGDAPAASPQYQHQHSSQRAGSSSSSSSAEFFSVHVGTSTKALRNSKGRTSITIQCSSPGECAKYVSALQCIRRSYDEY